MVFITRILVIRFATKKDIISLSARLHQILVPTPVLSQLLMKLMPLFGAFQAVPVTLPQHIVMTMVIKSPIICMFITTQQLDYPLQQVVELASPRVLIATAISDIPLATTI